MLAFYIYMLEKLNYIKSGSIKRLLVRHRLNRGIQSLSYVHYTVLALCLIHRFDRFPAIKHISDIYIHALKMFT
jgi:hypothetical protein